jgi:hypothetical protein
MEDARDAFERSRKEIERYFGFLQPFLDPTSSSAPSQLDTELQKIFKAAAMLLLYNVLEASVRNGMLAVYDSVNAAGIDYATASEELRHAWLDQRLRSLDRLNTRYDTFRKHAHELLDNVVRCVALEFDLDPERALDLAGNVDARKIRELATKHGINLNEELGEDRGFRLLEVKTLRNRLAHGFLSFADCGRDLDWSAMNGAKDQVVEYLRAWFDCLDVFVQSLATERTGS